MWQLPGHEFKCFELGRSARFGADAVLTKPFQIDTLVPTVEHATLKVRAQVQRRGHMRSRLA